MSENRELTIVGSLFYKLKLDITNKYELEIANSENLKGFHHIEKRRM